MKARCYAAVVSTFVGTLAAGVATAQDAVMNSAETINPGNIKLAGYAVRDMDADETGLVARAGIGFAGGVDVEGRVGFYDGLRYFAGDLELWLVRGPGVDLSVGGGLHQRDFEAGPDVFGIDAFAIASGHLNPDLELYGSLDLDFERPDDPLADFTLAHAVAGLEIAASDSMDLHVEGGLGMNDRSSDYLAAGIAIYLR
jgi:hypothetical protein